MCPKTGGIAGIPAEITVTAGVPAGITSQYPISILAGIPVGDFQLGLHSISQLQLFSKSSKYKK